jgi:hypothetical protein
VDTGQRKYRYIPSPIRVRNILAATCDGEATLSRLRPSRNGARVNFMSAQSEKRPALPAPDELVGTFRRFGPFGPAYKITGVLEPLSEGDAMLQAEVVETGEKIQRRYSFTLQDPEET